MMENLYPKRKALRLKNYDYSSPGAYFITMCSHDRACILSEIVGAIHESPLQARSIVSKTVGYIKMNASREIHRHCPDLSVWQRAFHDHVVRDEAEYIKIAEYIDENPIRWHEDCFYKP